MSIKCTLLCLKPRFLDPLLTSHPFRLAYDGKEASNCYQNQREDSSNHSSPYKTPPRPPRDPRSMPPTPVMTRNAYSSSQLRCDLQPNIPLSPQQPKSLLLPKAIVETSNLCFNNKSKNIMPIIYSKKMFQSCVPSPGQRGLLIASGIAVEVWSHSLG